MLLVLDANVLFSTLIKMGKTLDIVFNHNFEIISPDFILEEFIEHKDEISTKAKLNYIQLLTAIVLLSEKVNFVSVDKYKQHILEATKISPDEDDVDYFALAIKSNCAIWSNDKKLKSQDRVNVYSTEELIDYLKLA